MEFSRRTQLRSQAQQQRTQRSSFDRWKFHNLMLETTADIGLGDRLLSGSTDEDEISERSEEQKLRELEAILFLARDGVNSRKLAKLGHFADATEARTLVKRLNKIYDQTQRPYRIEEAAGGYAIMTRAHFAPWLRRLNHIPNQLKLSQTATETLAVVAYRQPVLRATIEAIRGVGCSEVLKQLMEADLVRISGRSEELGRPYLYGTTKRFLQIFGLRSADRLPRKDWVNQPIEENSKQTGSTSPT